METTFKVEWRKQFRKLTIYLSCAIIIQLVLLLFIRFVFFGYDETFKHVSPTESLLFLLGVPIFCAIFALPIAYWFKTAAVTITDTEIKGRNLWGRKRSIPLSDIKGLGHYSNNGIRAIIVRSKSHGEIYISDHTEQVEDIVKLLITYLPNNENK